MATEAGGLTNTPMLEQVFVNPDHSSQVLYQLSELWRDKKLCDATIEVGPVKVYVHRLVLLAACPYLLTVGGQHEVSILEVKLPMTVGLEGLNIFLTYLYDGVLHLTSANLRSVEKLTKILKVTSIQKFCQEFRDSNKETGTADKITTDYSLKMTNSSLQIIFSEIQNEMKRESAEPEIEPTPSKRPRMNLDKLSAALQKKSSQSDVVKDSGRGHSVSGGNSISNVASSGPSEIQHDDRDKSVDPLLMHVKEEPMSDYDDEDDTSFSEDTSESQGYSGTTDFVRQAPYDTRPFPDEEAVSRGSKMVVALPPPPSLQKRPSLKRKSFHPSAQHTSQTSETDSGGVNEDVNPGDIGTSGEGGVDATKVLKNIVKSMPEMAMNLGTSSEIGEDNKPRGENIHIRQRNKSVSDDNARVGVFHCKAPGCHYQSGRLFNLNRHVMLRHISSKKRSQRTSKQEKAPKRIEKVKVKKMQRSISGEVKEQYLDCQYPGCRFRTARMYNLKRHVAFRHAGPPKGEATNMCEKCGEIFVFKEGLEHHRQTVHAGLFRYMCKICEDGFQNLADFQSHMSQHIKAEIYHCDHCDITFQCSDDLDTHLKTCDQVPKGRKGMYRCQWCMERFSRKEVLTDHIKVHSSSKTYPCEVDGCGRVFTYQSALNKHLVNKHWALGLAGRRESVQRMYVTVSEGDSDKGLDDSEQPVFMTSSEREFDKNSSNIEQPVLTTLSETGFISVNPELS